MKSRILGAVVLSAAAFGLIPALARLPGSGSLAERTLDHAASRSCAVEVRFDTPSGLVVGDPVLSVGADHLTAIGKVASVRPGIPETVTLILDPFVARRLGKDAVVFARHPGSNLGWALQTLTPSELRSRVLRYLEVVWAKEGESLLADASPVFRERLGDLVSAAAAAVPDAVERRRADWEPVLQRLKAEIYDAELSPVLNAELWPKVRAECGTAVAAFADDLVRELGLGSLVRATWARTKDAVGFGDEKAFAAEIERLVNEKALPVAQRRAPEMLDAGMRAASRAAESPVLRAAVNRAVDRVLADVEARRALAAVIKSAFVEDPRVVAAWRAMIEDERLRSVSARIAKAVEPVFESAMQEALLREDAQGLDLRLVRVLRNVLLWKDRRYAALETSTPPSADVPPTEFRGPLRGLR